MDVHHRQQHKHTWRLHLLQGIGRALIVLVLLSTQAYSVPHSLSGSSNPTYGVLPSYNDVYANWKNAGLLAVGGIPSRSAVCASVNPLGGGQDDLANIQDAINSCRVGEVVQLGAGTFTISMNEHIALNKSVTLRGTGTCNKASSPYCQTVINVYNGALPYYSGGKCGTDTSHVVNCVSNVAIFMSPAHNQYDFGWSTCGARTAITNGCTTFLDTDAVQGQMTIQVHDTSHFSVGTWTLIDEASGAGWVTDPYNAEGASYGQVWAASDFLSSSGFPATGRVQWHLHNPSSGGDDIPGGQFPYNNGWWCTYSFCDRVTAEIHLVKSIGRGPCPGVNCTLTFDDPISVAFRQSGGHNAQVYWPTNQSGSVSLPFLEYAGVENLTILKPTNGGVYIQFCAYCWVRNVEVGGWFAGAVNTEYSARVQIDSSYLHDCYDCENNGAEYPVGISSASTEIYVTNNIIIRGGKGMVGRTGSAAVIAYNYVDDTFYQANSIGDYWQDMGVNGSHFAGTHHWLFEGNWGDNLDNDNTHGNAAYHTYFRNWGTALRTRFTDPSNGKIVDDANGLAYANGQPYPYPPGPLRAAGPMGYDYWFAYVGNVLGTSRVTTAANGWSYQGNYASNKHIWMLGWNSDARCPTCSDANLDGTNASYIFRHGNYDYVNGSIQWDSLTPDHSLPNSFYLSSRPTFFDNGSGYSWPWVTPENGTTQLQKGCNGSCSGLPAKARWDAGTPFVQP
jgi:hypothetical protein